MTTATETPLNSGPTPEEATLDLSAKGVWQPLPNETAHSYGAFTRYLELGLDATLQQVSQVTGRSLSSLCALSARHHWIERATAYRQHVAHTFLVQANRERAKQTELAQLRDQLHRQQMWEDAQLLRELARKAVAQRLSSPVVDMAAYEIKGRFELGFRLGKGASAPTGFTSEGPAPANPDFEASLATAYGGGIDWKSLIESINQAHPGQEAVIDE